MSASYLRKYATNAGADIYINITKAGSANHAVGADWTPSAGDVKVSIDGAASANIGTLPTSIAMGNSAIWKFVFTAGELTGKFINVTVSDSATKAVDDTGFSIETYGNASALHPFDLGIASSAQTGDSFAVVNSGTFGNSALKTLIDTLDNFVDTEVADIQARLPAALVSGRMDSNMQAGATGVISAALLASDAANEIADALLDRAAGVETGLTPRELYRITFAALAGILAGAATTTVTIRNLANTKDRITATVDADGNRSAVTLDLT